MEERRELLIFCGLAGLIGSFVPTLLNIVAAGIAEHDFVADTISDLGRGPHKWIMDTGFYIGAAGLLGLATVSAHVHLGRRGWSLGILTLLLTALVTVLLGVWDDFGGGDSLSVHTRLTFLLGPLYAAGPVLMAGAFWRRKRWIALCFVSASVIWITFATAFKLAPDGLDGILEKIAVIGTLLWTVPLSWFMLRRGFAV